jgi:hypothetical protein
MRQLYLNLEFGEGEPKNGYTRVYKDFMGRWYTDYTDEELEEYYNDPICKIFASAIREEIDNEVVKKLVKYMEDFKPDYKQLEFEL